MQTQQHQPAGHAFAQTMLKILQRTEVLLQRRIGAEDERPAPLDGLEVRESTWAEWEAAVAETA